MYLTRKQCTLSTCFKTGQRHRDSRVECLSRNEDNIDSFEPLKQSSMVRAVLLNSALIIPSNKQYTSMTTYVDFVFQSSGLIDVDSYLLLKLENTFVYSDTMTVSHVSGCGSNSIAFTATRSILPDSGLNISVSKAIPKLQSCTIRISSITLPSKTKAENASVLVTLG